MRTVTTLAGLMLGLLLLPAPAAAQERDSLLMATRIGVVAGQALDLGTTTYGIQTGAVSEANPLMGWAANEPVVLSAMKMGTAAGLDWSLRTLARRGHRKKAIVLGVALMASSAFVAIHNMREIREGRR